MGVDPPWAVRVREVPSLVKERAVDRWNLGGGPKDDTGRGRGEVEEGEREKQRPRKRGTQTPEEVGEMEDVFR